MRRIGILGGTFNPLHKGHLQIAEGAQKLFSLNKVYFVPSGESYHKEYTYIPDRQDRVRMLELALEGNPEFAIATCDLDREGPTYTIDTLKAMREIEPEAEFFLIMGSDVLMDVLSWNSIEEIAKKVRFLVALRKGYSKPVLDAFLEEVPEYFENKVVLFDWPISDFSSQDIKEKKLKKKYFPKGVYEYILEKGLYPDDVR